MEDLRYTFLALDRSRKRQVHIALCQHALDVWEAYAQGHAPFDYRDSVVGAQHRIDPLLPRDALRHVWSKNHDPSIAERYYEPIVALQHADLVFPAHIEFAYYAIYNLHQAYIVGRMRDGWLIVNQALASETDPARWKTLLVDALRRARPADT